MCQNVFQNCKVNQCESWFFHQSPSGEHGLLGPAGSKWPWCTSAAWSLEKKHTGFSSCTTWRFCKDWEGKHSMNPPDFTWLCLCYSMLLCVCVLHLTFALLCPSMMLSHSKMAPANTYDKAWRHTFQVFWDWHSHSTAHSHKGTLPWCQGRGAFSWLIGSESIFPS